MAAWLETIASLVWPPQCVGCRRVGAWWCDACDATVRVSTNVRCPGCETSTQHARYCNHCQQSTPLQGIIAGASLSGKLPTGIKALKYRHAKAVVPALARYPLAALDEHRAVSPRFLRKESSTLLVTVPLHPKKLRMRGHNQAALISRSLAASSHLPMLNNLTRLRHTPSQTGLDKNQRRSNVEQAFGWNSSPLRGQTVYLVDDVATTGATLAACGTALRNVGAGEVWGLVIARREFVGRRIR